LRRATHHRRGSKHQQFTDFLVPCLGDPPEAGLAAGGVLAWHQPEPGSEMTRTLEGADVVTDRRAEIIDAVIGPMPGTVARRRAVSSCRGGLAAELYLPAAQALAAA